MSTPDRQQPAGQPAAQPYVPAQPAPQGVPQAGMPAQSAAPAQPAPQGVPQTGMPAQSAAPAQPAAQGVPQTGTPAQSVAPAQPAAQGVPQAGMPAQSAAPAQPAPQGVPQTGMPAQSAAPAQPAPQGYVTASQGFAPGYAPVPQGPVKVRVNCVSLVFGIGVWVFIALLVLDAWVEMHSPHASASGLDIIGFFPLFVLGICGPFNLIGVIMGFMRAKEKPAKWKLNRLGIILNASPYVILAVFMFVVFPVALLWPRS